MSVNATSSKNQIIVSSSNEGIWPGCADLLEGPREGKTCSLKVHCGGSI